MARSDLFAKILAVVLVVGAGACGDDSTGGGSGDGGTGDASGLGDGQVTGDGSQCTNSCTTPGVLQCDGTILKVCAQDAPGCLAWTVQQDCAEANQVCDDSGDTPACVTPASCHDGIQNQDESDKDCGGVCPPCPVASQCNEDEDCESKACTNGICQLCKAGTFSCFGNTVRQCANDEGSWTDVATCDPFTALTKCDAASGTCVPIPLVGNPPGPNDENVTGVYYKFASFTADDGLIRDSSHGYAYSGADVDCYQDLIFANRDGEHVDVYRITLLDSDGDGKLEPNQHPDNPDAQGPIEERTLTFVETYDIHSGFPSMNAMYVTADRFYFPQENPQGSDGNTGDLFEYVIATGQTNKVIDSDTMRIHQNSYDPVEHRWYASNEYARRIYSFAADANEWVGEFEYPDMIGSHLDGQEFVADPNTGIGYLYVSDMTSDYIGQFTKDATGNWTQANLFRYNDPQGDEVEGLGYGVLYHFWSCGQQGIYELGGGDLSHYTDPTHGG